MNKTLKIILVGGIAVIVIFGIFLAFAVGNLDKIVKRTVESTGSAATGTPVQLAAVDISLANRSAALDGLNIKNPEGFTTENALSLNNISVQLGEISRDEIIIETILVDGASVILEEAGTRTNLKTILDHIREFTGPADEAPAEDEPSAGPKLVIREFRFTNATAELISEKLGQSFTASIPDVVLTDIGENGNGVTAAEAAKQLMEPLIARALDAAQRQVLEEAKKKAAGELLNKLPLGSGG